MRDAKVYRILLGNALFELFEIKTLKQNIQISFGRAKWRCHVNRFLFEKKMIPTCWKFVDMMYSFYNIYVAFSIHLILILYFIAINDFKNLRQKIL